MPQAHAGRPGWCPKLETETGRTIDHWGGGYLGLFGMEKHLGYIF